MASNDIKQKIVLEGEKEYNRALSEAKRNLKTLRSELKAETAELGANATAQQKNETRIKSLQKQIKEQEKVVKTYQDALKEVKEKYGDNEDAVAKWEQKLNEARYSLANMRNELEGVGNSFKDVQGSADMATVATKSVADTFGKLSDIGGTISDGIESAFKGLLSSAKDTVEAIWGSIVDLAARSNNLVDLAGFWNTDVTTIQKYAGAVSEVSGTLEDLNSLVTKINAGDSKKIAELTGVSSENYADQWEYAMAVMDAMSKISEGNRNRVAFDIFGERQATKAFDLLNDWEKLLDHLDKYDAEKGGFGLSEEELTTMSDLYDKVNGLKQSWQSLKDMATVKLFGQLSMDLTGNAQAIVDSFLKYFNAGSDEERNQALEEIENNITAMFETAKKAIEDGIALLGKIAEDLKASDNPTAQALGNILSGLVDALKWFTEDNMNNVVHALEILAGFWLTGKGLQMGAKIAEVVKDIAAIKAFKFAGAGSEIASGAASAGTAAGTSFGAAFLKGFIQAAPALASVLGITAVAIAPALAAQADAEKKVEERRERRLEAAGNLDNSQDAQFLQQMADALGLKRDANGNLVKNIIGQNWIGGNEAEIERMLMGMGDRSDLEKAQLYNILKETYTGAGYSTWAELQRMWSGEGLDLGRMTALAEAIADAYSNGGPSPDWWTTQGGNAGNTDGLTAVDAQNMTSAVQQMPSAVAKGISGIRVNLDGQTVGRLVAPYVSQQIAQEIQ